MRNIGFLLFCIIIALPLKSHAADEAVLLQAEDALGCTDLQLDKKNKDTLAKLISDRQALLLSINTDAQEERDTRFGTAYSDPKPLQDWKTKENGEVRKLIPEDKVKAVEDYATATKEKLATVKNQFPYRAKIPFAFAEVQPPKPTDEYLLEIQAEVNSPLYEIRIDKISVTNGNALVEVSLVRPSDRTLYGKTPEKTVIKKTVTLNKTPRDIKVFYRTVILDMPGNASYNLIAQIAPANPAPL